MDRGRNRQIIRDGAFTATEPNCLSDNTSAIPTTGPRFFLICRTVSGPMGHPPRRPQWESGTSKLATTRRRERPFKVPSAHASQGVEQAEYRPPAAGYAAGVLASESSGYDVVTDPYLFVHH